jgi:hypothetical protein
MVEKWSVMEEEESRRSKWQKKEAETQGGAQAKCRKDNDNCSKCQNRRYLYKSGL